MSNLTYLADDQTSTVRDYFSLLKIRVMSLVIFSAITGLVIAPGKIHIVIAFMAVLCTAIGAGAAGVLNMWYDRDIDALMQRTSQRPIITGKINADEALFFGITLSILSVLTMFVCVNAVAAILLLISILFYIIIYTMWLKRTSIQNIVIGGAAGAFPPMIGWSAVTNSIDMGSILLFLIIFFWTPPHFWALALYKTEDYKRAQIPMMPIVKGDTYTKVRILSYSIVTLMVSTLPYLYNIAGTLYLSIAIVAGGYFIYLVGKLYLDQSNKVAPQVFGNSIIYLFTIFGALIIDHYILLIPKK